MKERQPQRVALRLARMHLIEGASCFILQTTENYLCPETDIGMAEITFNCPHCNATLEAASDMAGASTECPSCSTKIKLPGLGLPRKAVSIRFKPQRRTYRTPASTGRVAPHHAPMGAIGVLLFLLVIAGVICAVAKKKASGALQSGTKVGTGLLVAFVPDTVIDGQVFIVTKGGQNIKLGLVEVQLISLEKLDSYLKQKHEELRKRLAEVDTQRKTAEVGTSEWRSLVRLGYRLRSGSLYFEYPPKAIRSVKTDADGKFTIKVPSTGRFALAAAASRQVGGEDDLFPTEYYYWLVKIDAEGKGSDKIMLSNDNLISSGSSSCLVETD